MGKTIKHLLYIAVSITIGIVISDGIVYENVKNILSSLQQVSAAVFALTGIWIAYLYPEALTSLANPEKVSLLKGTKNTERIESLVLIIISSAIVLLATLVFDYLYALKTLINFSANINLILKISGFSLVTYLCFIQINSIFSILIANIRFVNDLHNKKESIETNNDL